MKESIKVWYSVQNGGDGSANTIFMESKELCEWDQDHMDEGWGESCIGCFEFAGDNVEIITNIITKEEYYKNTYLRGSDWREKEIPKFINQFFPEGLPDYLDTEE